MTEHSHDQNAEAQQDTAPRFVVAKRLEHNPDVNAPSYEIQDQPTETLPVLTSEQLDLMGRLAPEEWNTEKLDSLGLPVGEGIVAVSVDGEKRFVNIDLNDYGTVIRDKNIKVVPGAEAAEPKLFSESAHNEAEASAEHNEVLSVEAIEELGHDAIDATGIDEPAETEEREQDVEDEEAAEQINALPEHVLEAVGTFLRQNGQEVEERLNSSRREASLLEELQHGMNTFRYGGTGNKHQLIQQQMDFVGQLSGAFQGDAANELRPSISRFSQELEEAADALKKDEKTSEELRTRTRILRDAADEIESNGRVADTMSAELADEARSLMRAFDDFLNDDWGGEHYVALISQKLQTLEESLMSRTGRLHRIQEELPALQRAVQ